MKILIIWKFGEVTSYCTCILYKHDVIDKKWPKICEQQSDVLRVVQLTTHPTLGVCCILTAATPQALPG